MSTLALAVFCVLAGIIGTVMVAGMLIIAWPHITRKRAPDWLCKLRGEPTWAKPCTGSVTEGCDVNAEWIAVSRHDPAEAALKCPICHTEVAAAGEFHRVQRAIIDGFENEVIRCPGLIVDEATKEPRKCNVFLVASPDTEHGDHLGPDGEIDITSELTPEMHRFKRSTAVQIMRERWGADLKGTPEAILLPKDTKPEGAVSTPDIAEVPLDVAVAMQYGMIKDTDPKYQHLKPKE